MENKDNIEKLYQDNLSQNKVTMNADLMAKLDKISKKEAQRVRRNKVIKNTLISGSVAIILFTGAYLYFSSESNKKSTSSKEKLLINSVGFDTLDKWEEQEFILEQENVNDPDSNDNVQNKIADKIDIDIDEKSNNPETVKHNAPNGSLKHYDYDYDSNSDSNSNSNLEKDKFESTTTSKRTNGNFNSKEDYEDYSKSIKKYKIKRVYASDAIGQAQKNIDMLHDGVLLVRLKTKQNTIDAYKKAGYHRKAEAVAAEQLKTNQRIAQSFKENFNFCPVFFFLSTESKNIKNGDYKNLILDHNLKKVNPDLTLKPIYIADFGRARQDGNYKEGVYVETGLFSRVIVLQDNRFNQLRAPFPYYQKAVDHRKDAKNIKKLNIKLWDFYSADKY